MRKGDMRAEAEAAIQAAGCTCIPPVDIRDIAAGKLDCWDTETERTARQAAAAVVAEAVPAAAAVVAEARPHPAPERSARATWAAAGPASRARAAPRMQAAAAVGCQATSAPAHP